MDEAQIRGLLKSPATFRDHVKTVFQTTNWPEAIATLPRDDLKRASVVLLIISQCPSQAKDGAAEPCLVLNKRSPQVKQAGDLCCPGGGLNWVSDNLYARLLQFPGAPLGSPRVWQEMGIGDPGRQRKIRSKLPVLVATGLRESWEEMRLNPLRFKFLGMLPEQHLVMFKRVIYPVLGWSDPQSYKPNWEVQRVVSVALRNLLDPANYARFRPVIPNHTTADGRSLKESTFPCYVHNGLRGSELLWGATYRIVQTFLELVFNFSPPESDDMPVFERALDETYLNGSR